MSHPSKKKGYASEIEFRNLMRTLGFRASRRVLSGALASQPGDVLVEAPSGRHLIEVKRRRRFPSWLTGWMRHTGTKQLTGLAFRSDGSTKDWLVAVRLEDFVYWAGLPESIRLLPLTQGQFALIDAEDWEAVKGYSWYASPATFSDGTLRTFYVVGTRPGSTETVKLHRLLLDPGAGYDVDHKNGNGLDNRRENLRVCSRSQNLQNRRPWHGRIYKGVYAKTPTSWAAKITVRGQGYYLGSFKKQDDAAVAYNKAARKFFGQFARLNRIPKPKRNP